MTFYIIHYIIYICKAYALKERTDDMTFPLTAPIFDMLVLSIIAEDDAYGYQISQRIKQVAPMKDSSLYPVLKRLQEGSHLETYDQQYQGRNRRYYVITDSGRIYLGELLEEWERYATQINGIIRDGRADTRIEAISPTMHDEGGITDDEK